MIFSFPFIFLFKNFFSFSFLFYSFNINLKQGHYSHLEETLTHSFSDVGNQIHRFKSVSDLEPQF